MAPRLLFDENLSDRLPRLVANAYSGSRHVAELGLRAAPDEVIWARARAEDMLLVTKDEDFQRLSVWRGAPPKVLWICLGNFSTQDVASLLERSVDVVTAFVAHPEVTFLSLGQG